MRRAALCEKCREELLLIHREEARAYLLFIMANGLAGRNPMEASSSVYHEYIRAGAPVNALARAAGLMPDEERKIFAELRAEVGWPVSAG